MRDDESSYIRVTLADTSYFDLPFHHYDTFISRWKAFMLNTPHDDELYEDIDLCGGRIAFRLSAVQDAFESTPEIRAESSRLNKLVKEEQQQVEGWTDD